MHWVITIACVHVKSYAAEIQSGNKNLVFFWNQNGPLMHFCVPTEKKNLKTKVIGSNYLDEIDK